MNVAQMKMTALGVAVLLVVTIGFGLWLALSGKPYHNLLFTVHKLAGLGTSVFLILLGYNLLKNISPAGLVMILFVLAVLSVLTLLVSGALMSLNNPAYSLMKTMHIAATVLAIVCSGGMIAFLIRQLK